MRRCFQSKYSNIFASNSADDLHFSAFHLKSSPERAFIRGGRLFESGRLLLRAIHMRVVSICDGSWLFDTHSRQCYTWTTYLQSYLDANFTPNSREAEAIDFFFATSTAFSL